MEHYYSGLKLYGLAQEKARTLGIQATNAKMEPLICKIQELEGNIVCFRQKEYCGETKCCWQAACGAKMYEQ